MASVNDLAARIAQLKQDLSVDKALSEGQLQHYDLTLQHLSELRTRTVWLALTRGSYRYRTTNFIVDPSEAARCTNGLRHLAGVAEMRRRLGVERSAWRSDAGTLFHRATPDAYWQDQTHIIAIEYDVGSYSTTQIVAKASAFTAFAGQIWGCASKLRARRLSAILRMVDPQAVCLYAPWD
jgi:hypothetical protein